MTTRRAGAALIALLLLGAACTSGSGTSSASSGESGASSAAPVTELTVAGTDELAGPMRDAIVTCEYPTVDGQRIAVLATSPDGKTSYRVTIGPDSVDVHADTGAGSDFVERNFEGPGVTGFDAAVGGTVDAVLHDEAPTPGIDTGNIGQIIGIKGHVECTGQTPGTSTIAVTGDSPLGHYEASRLDPVNVRCYASSGEVIVLGIAQAGTTKVQLLVSLSAEGIGVEESGPPGTSYRYHSDGGAVIVDAGATANGDVMEQNADPPHMLHVEGDAQCGTPLGK